MVAVHASDVHTDAGLFLKYTPCCSIDAESISAAAISACCFPYCRTAAVKVGLCLIHYVT